MAYFIAGVYNFALRINCCKKATKYYLFYNCFSFFCSFYLIAHARVPLPRVLPLCIHELGDGNDRQFSSDDETKENRQTSRLVLQDPARDHPGNGRERDESRVCRNTQKATRHARPTALYRRRSQRFRQGLWFCLFFVFVFFLFFFV